MRVGWRFRWMRRNIDANDDAKQATQRDFRDVVE